MTDYTIGGLESPADGHSTDIGPRDARALTECMTTIPLGGDVYSVTTESGVEYRVDAREGRCTCLDHKHRGVRCKHIRRVAYATGETEIPSWISFAAVDPLLGKHVDENPVVAVADGGSTEDADECEDCIDGVAPCFECYKAGAKFPEG